MITGVCWKMLISECALAVLKTKRLTEWEHLRMRKQWFKDEKIK
jgi:hypothetical protein